MKFKFQHSCLDISSRAKRTTWVLGNFSRVHYNQRFPNTLFFRVARGSRAALWGTPWRIDLLCTIRTTNSSTCDKFGENV